MNWEYEAAWLCDCALAVVFAASAWGKAQTMTDMRMEIKAYGLMPANLVPAAAWAALALEWVLAAAFAKGGTLEGVKEPAAIIVLLGLTGLSRRRHLAANKKNEMAGAAECGCFGANHPLSRRPMLRNVLFVAVAAAAWIAERPAPSGAGLAAFALVVASTVWLLETFKLQNETGEWRAGDERAPG
ncbi:MauE/DoxX family redox-associated membrane protein [Cohnella rhizosphaerae]|uniref:Methylamine utilisation protein MauE domain-containing protein n=1 Tax=Cohnella rhizosphaerae TaxID=1457232 RepID=A0A9X4L168_9BACL|nr:MauE/DoxX family redox-associated membrane protein [Cohnella rhizosphaerae]MDG0814640.1 hypothetical protein [Cohnella rhizosphaerae]